MKSALKIKPASSLCDCLSLSLSLCPRVSSVHCADCTHLTSIRSACVRSARCTQYAHDARARARARTRTQCKAVHCGPRLSLFSLARGECISRGGYFVAQICKFCQHRRLKARTAAAGARRSVTRQWCAPEPASSLRYYYSCSDSRKPDHISRRPAIPSPAPRAAVLALN